MATPKRWRNCSALSDCKFPIIFQTFLFLVFFSPEKFAKYTIFSVSTLFAASYQQHLSNGRLMKERRARQDEQQQESWMLVMWGLLVIQGGVILHHAGLSCIMRDYEDFCLESNRVLIHDHDSSPHHWVEMSQHVFNRTARNAMICCVLWSENRETVGRDLWWSQEVPHGAWNLDLWEHARLPAEGNGVCTTVVVCLFVVFICFYMFLRFETLNYCTVHVLFCVLAYAIQLMDLLGAFSWRRRFAADDPNVAHLEKDDENRETCFFCWVVGMGLL